MPAPSLAEPSDHASVEPPPVGADGAGKKRTPPPARSPSLVVRLVGTYALIVAATIIVIAALALHLTRQHLYNNLDRELAETAAAFTKGPARAAHTPAQLRSAARHWLATQALLDEQVAIRTADGRVLASEGPFDLHRVRGGREALLATDSGWWNLDSPTGPVRALAVPIRLGRHQVATIVIFASSADVQKTVSAIRAGIAWASVIGLLFAILLCALAVHSALRRLRRMSREVLAIEETGDLSRRISYRGARDEVGSLAEAFDRMLARLEGAFESQRRFFSNASHELRTPLTVAHGQLELAAQEIEQPDVRRSLEIARTELARMGTIVEDLLLLARLDEGLSLAQEPVEVELVLREALLRGMLLAPREARVEAEPGIFALADRDRLLQVLTNLVTNAIQHTPPEASLVLRTGRADAHAFIEVADNGPGIPPEDIPRVFSRLYRGRTATAESPGGAGLGLPIAASLVQAMGGDIVVRSTAGVGTTFTIRLSASEVLD